MPRTSQLLPLIPPLATAVERFLVRSRFSARTRDSYAQDLAPLLAHVGDQPVATAVTPAAATAFLAGQEHLSVATYNRRYAALRSFVRWCRTQGWLDDDPLAGLERRSQARNAPRALDPEQVEAVLRSIRDVRDRTLFWLIYDGALRCREALAVNIEDIDWRERCISVQGKGDRPREMFFSRRVAGYLDTYIKDRASRLMARSS